jgi:hypothetical protein
MLVVAVTVPVAALKWEALWLAAVVVKVPLGVLEETRVAVILAPFVGVSGESRHRHSVSMGAIRNFQTVSL